MLTCDVMNKKKNMTAKATRELEKRKDTEYTIGMVHQHVSSCV